MKYRRSPQDLSPDGGRFSDRVAATFAADRTPVLWTVETDRLPPNRVDRWSECLDGAERGRADTLLQAHDRRDAIAAHALRRALLSAVLRRPPNSWRFTQSVAHGKPLLVFPDTDAGPNTIDVSLTHTRGLVAAVVGCGCRVGVDAEALARPGSVDDLIPVVLSLQEARLVRAHGSEADRTQAFLSRWVVKEAVAKLLGLGLAHPLTHLETRESPLSVQIYKPWPSIRPAPELRRLRPTPNHVLAVAATESRPGLPDLIWRHLDAASLDRALTRAFPPSV